MNNLKAKIKADKIREISLRYSMGEIRGSFSGVAVSKANKQNPPKKKKWNEHAVFIRKFWEIRFTGSEHKLMILKEYADIKLLVTDKRRRRKRRAFNQMYDSLYALRTSKCWVCGNSAHHRHHIIQLQNGGSNSPKNIVAVCSGCHAEIHPWLQASRPI